MSGRPITKGAREKGNENVRKKVHFENAAQKPFVFQSSKPSPQLSDKSEFPSLNEISGITSNNSQSTKGALKYSDKLKLHTSVQNQNSNSNFFHFKDDPIITDAYKELHRNSSCSRISNKWFHNEKGVFPINKPNEPDISITVNEKVVNINSPVSIPKAQSNHSFREPHSSKFDKNQSSKQSTSNSKLNSSNKTSPINSTSTSLSYKSSNQEKPKSEVKLILGKSPVNEGNDASGSSTTKKKKKRKSKVKRQIALQPGKITVLSPEVHSKILNQTSVLTSQSYRGIWTDINDEEEYPELGKSFVPASQKENYPKKESNHSEPIQEATDKIHDAPAESQLIITKDVMKESLPVSITRSKDKSVLEKKGKSENKPVHPNDPITVSFLDILVNKSYKTKAKDLKVEDEPPTTTGIPKYKDHKNLGNPHNLLDSSSPAVKRGKERENPRPKKPSQLKKIILLDRKVRREQLLQSKSNNIEDENAVIENESENEAFENKEIDIIQTNIPTENSYDNGSSSSMLPFQLEVLLPFENDLALQDDLISDMETMNISGMNERWNSLETPNNLSSIATTEDIKSENITEESAISSSLDEVFINEASEHVYSDTTTDSLLASEKHLNITKSPDLLLNSLISDVKKLNTNDKEKAVKVLLHTRNFREYCNHLLSKDIDDAVFALLDDLARFQDRLHQKDPIKARMKRRMIYGVKEVKKHIKLKKLKCIVVAADIENIEAHGGLNDLLNDIKSSAADHHIPCVFALSRKVLGKVCRKPVPVSCVGVFNYEGSEANFKKMVELQNQSKADYAEISNRLSETLTEEQVISLLKAKKEAPETLRALRTNILGDFFREEHKASDEHDRMTVSKSDKLSDSSDTES